MCFRWCLLRSIFLMFRTPRNPPVPVWCLFSPPPAPALLARSPLCAVVLSQAELVSCLVLRDVARVFHADSSTFLSVFELLSRPRFPYNTSPPLEAIAHVTGFILFSLLPGIFNPSLLWVPLYRAPAAGCYTPRRLSLYLFSLAIGMRFVEI